jgi:hypothetical protein
MQNTIKKSKARNLAERALLLQANLQNRGSLLRERSIIARFDAVL